MRRQVMGVAAVIMMGAASASWAGEGVRVEHPWARATAGDAPNGAVFMTVTDASGQGDALVAAESPAATTVELHVHQESDGIMRMRAVPSLPIPAGGSITLKPGAEHVMLMGLKRPLKEGDTVPLVLTFAKAGTVHARAMVRGVGAMDAAGEHP
ncbi:MAG: hypothetical protein FD149_1169 [Rhodospirillaceae bacterium]|nr:MAG: hypothetical protein FD149_1169 [Rhodospirillaceae bacterium]